MPRTSGDFFGSAIVMLVLIAMLGFMIAYIGLIVLFVFLCVGLGIGFAYAMYIYIKNFIASIKMSSGVTSSTLFKTFVLKWFTVFKESARLSFIDNFTVAQNAVIKSRACKWTSFKKWMWLIVAPSTLVVGTAIIACIILVQFCVLAGIAAILFAVVVTLCALLFAAALAYSAVALFKNLPAALAGKTPTFKTFDFTPAASVKNLGGYIKEYFKTTGGYIVGIWSENLALGSSNVRMASGYKLFSFTRYFLYVSVAALVVVAVVADILTAVIMLVLFPILFVANLLWLPIAAIVRAV